MAKRFSKSIKENIIEQYRSGEKTPTELASQY